MMYCVARYKKIAEEKAYRIYTSDLLMAMCERVTGLSIDKRYIDVIEPSKVDERSCEEITADVVERCGLVVKNEPT